MGPEFESPRVYQNRLVIRKSIFYLFSALFLHVLTTAHLYVILDIKDYGYDLLFTKQMETRK